MKVILLETVRGSGKAGDVVNVSDGYARNLLIPKGLAQEATPQNMARLKKTQERIAKKMAEDRESAQKQAEILANTQVEIRAKAGENGKVFGSVTSKDIAEALNAQGFEIDKKKIKLDAPIKELGVTTVEIKLFNDINGKIKVNVIPE
ncbi:MAG: 50S ribosomal protein L9 [Firmicutes bacterium]|nr:50S ribosomal protein L9 [Bacillota bacterium]